MRIIHQQHQTETPIDADDIYARIEAAGRTCYKSESKGDPAAFVAKLINMGHHSVLEHVNLTVRFITDRGVTHELVRHRLAAFSQESTRYCDYGDGDVVFIKPVEFVVVGTFKRSDIFPTWIGSPPNEAVWLQAMLYAERCYQTMRKAGASPQLARAVLPNSLKTEIVVTANLREWRHILTLRTSGKAHPQIRDLMLGLLREFQESLPAIFADINAADQS